MFEIDKYIEPSGQRNAILVDSATGLPDYWSTLFVTNALRVKGLEVGTIEKHLEAIHVLYIWASIRNVDIEAALSSGIPFKQYEIDSLASLLKLPSDELNLFITEADKLTGVIDITTREKKTFWGALDGLPRQISAKGYNDKIRCIVRYVNWLSNTLSDNPSPSVSREQVSSVGREFSDRLTLLKAVETSGHFARPRAYSNAEIKRVLEVVNPTSPENPWDDEAVRVRNLAIILILLDTGIRSAELKNLKLTDVIRGKNTASGIKIVDRSGSKDDPRVHQPNPKTESSERSVPMTGTTFSALDMYVTKYRHIIPNAQSTGYIFLSHSNDPAYSGRPITSLNAITNKVRDITGVDLEPHRCRHTATWKFCLQQKKKGLKWDDFVEILILKFGWKNKESSVVRMYARKYLEDELFIKNLEEQENIAAKINDALKTLEGGN